MDYLCHSYPQTQAFGDISMADTKFKLSTCRNK